MLGGGGIGNGVGGTTTEEQWAREFDPTRVHRDEIAGGSLTATYESLVHSIFRPERDQPGTPLPPSFAPPGGLPPVSASQRILAGAQKPKISAAAMRRIEEQLGKDALDETYDDQLWKSPLDEIYTELGIGTPSLASASTEPSFAVYAPKTSSEYFSTASALPPANSYRSSALGTYRLGAPSSLRASSNSAGGPGAANDHCWRNTDRQTLLDYNGTSSTPFGAHLYQYGTVRSQDSRIVGSNFVQLTTRPKDRFLEKIDKTLAEVRSSPRYS